MLILSCRIFVIGNNEVSLEARDMEFEHLNERIIKIEKVFIISILNISRESYFVLILINKNLNLAINDDIILNIRRCLLS